MKLIVRERMPHFIKLKLLLGCFLGFSISFCDTIHAQNSQGFYLGISAIKDTSSYDFKRVETSPVYCLLIKIGSIGMAQDLAANPI